TGVVKPGAITARRLVAPLIKAISLSSLAVVKVRFIWNGSYNPASTRARVAPHRAWEVAGEADQALVASDTQEFHISRWRSAAERAYDLLTFHCLTGEVRRVKSFLPSLQGWAATELQDARVQVYAAAGVTNVVAVHVRAGDYTGALTE